MKPVFSKFIAKHLNTLTGLVLILFAMSSSAEMLDNNEQDDVINFGIVPQQAAAKLATQWIPLMRYLEKQTGKKVVFRTAPDIPTFEQRLMDGEYDFSYMNPYHYTVVNQSTGYNAVARARDKKLVGIMVVHKDSGIEKLEALRQQTLAFPSPAAFAASIIVRAELNNREIEFTPQYVSSHDSVYRGVAAGLYPAGGGVKRTFNSVDEKVREQLKILWTSPGSTPHAIAHHPRVTKNVVESVANALVALESSPEGLAILDKLKIKGFVHAIDSDWDDVRELKINSPVGLGN